MFFSFTTSTPSKQNFETQTTIFFCDDDSDQILVVLSRQLIRRMKFESKHAYKAQGEGLVINDDESRHEGFAKLGDELDFEYQLACPINHRLSARAENEDHCFDGLIHCVSFTLSPEVK